MQTSDGQRRVKSGRTRRIPAPRITNGRAIAPRWTTAPKIQIPPLILVAYPRHDPDLSLWARRVGLLALLVLLGTAPRVSAGPCRPCAMPVPALASPNRRPTPRLCHNFRLWVWALLGGDRIRSRAHRVLSSMTCSIRSRSACRKAWISSGLGNSSM